MTDLVSALRSDMRTIASPAVPPGSQMTSEAAIRNAAQEFEAVFLTEMLKHAGLGKMPEAMNGGVGEAAFADFLAREYAMGIAQTRSIGIADRVYDVLRAEGMK